MSVKAGEMLQSAGKFVGPAATNALGALERIGGRTGALVKKIEELGPPTKHALLTTKELAKIVYRERGMAPPSLSDIQLQFGTFWQTLKAGVPSPAAIREALSNRDSLKNGSIVAAELLGFFTVGEIIGKRKVVGFRGKVDHH